MLSFFRRPTPIQAAATPSGALPGNTTTDTSQAQQPVEAQQECRLFQLPPELRDQIWSYMTLSVTSEQSPSWSGAYYTCRQMQNEIRHSLKYNREDEIAAIEMNIARNSHFDHGNWSILTSSTLKGGLVSGITLNIPSFKLGCTCEDSALLYMYSLYLNHLSINLLGTKVAQLGEFRDLKGSSPWFLESSAKDCKVNCKRITMTLPHLANQPNGRAKQTALENMFGGNIPYTLVIVEDNQEHQVERTYTSATRFRPLEESTPAIHESLIEDNLTSAMSENF